MTILNLNLQIHATKSANHLTSFIKKWGVLRKYHFRILDRKQTTSYTSALFLNAGRVCCFLFETFYITSLFLNFKVATSENYCQKIRHLHLNILMSVTEVVI